MAHRDTGGAVPEQLKKLNPLTIESVDIVAPIYNEESNIDALVDRTVRTMTHLPYRFRLIMVDDGSADQSADKILEWVRKYPGHVHLVRLNRNYGQHAAIIAAFERCNADMVVTIDADLQNPPEEIPKLLQKAAEGYDVVGSIRKIRRDTIFRKVASKSMNWLTRRITGTNMRDYGCMLRAYHRDIIRAILMCEERFIYIPALANIFARNGAEVLVEHAERAAGKSKYNYWKLFTLFFDILTGTTLMPLRVLTVLGLLMCGASACFGVGLILLRVWFGQVWGGYGLFTLFGILFFFVGLQFFAFGVMGEYICRISMDVRRRPKYLVASEVGAEKPS